MQINSTNNSPSFERIGVQTSQMKSAAQRNIAEGVYRALEGSSKYKNLETETMDVLILAGKKENSVIVQFLDKISGKILRNKSNHQPVQMTYTGVGDKYSFSDKVVAKYKEVIDPNFPKPLYKLSDILNDNTDLARLNPTEHEKGLNEYYALLSEGSGSEYAEIAMLQEFKAPSDYDF